MSRLLTTPECHQLREEIEDSIGRLRARLNAAAGRLDGDAMYLSPEPPHEIRYRHQHDVMRTLRNLHFALLDAREALTAETA